MVVGGFLLLRFCGFWMVLLVWVLLEIVIVVLWLRVIVLMIVSSSLLFFCLLVCWSEDLI